MYNSGSKTKMELPNCKGYVAIEMLLIYKIIYIINDMQTHFLLIICSETRSRITFYVHTE